MEHKFTYFWFRRDLRVNDNHGFYQALNSGNKVKPIFIFDTNILSKLSQKNDARVEFIHQQVSHLKTIFNGNHPDFEGHSSDIEVWYGDPVEVWTKILSTNTVAEIFTNTDYEPNAITRDVKIAKLCENFNCNFRSFKDQVIFEKSEVTKDDGLPYTVFTPYMKKWKLRYLENPPVQYPSESNLQNLATFKFGEMPSLSDMGFEKSGLEIPSMQVEQGRIKNYEQTRDIPSVLGTSRLSIHLRFGTISVREKVLKGFKLSEKWVNELIWRDFYQQIIFHFPRIVNESFKPQYDKIEWLNDEKSFELWTQGKTGYPIVDAGMRELNITGFMHNRVRMIVASFLTKHLLIDWRWGEAYFAEKLLDFDLASNNGGWQWAAGSGVDAAPYFRVFNPTLQTQKFDPELKYIKTWVPEFGTAKYPKPMVEHSVARDRCLATYKKGLGRLEGLDD
jgi:deoxyribodipyrimidine photo-lyase